MEKSEMTQTRELIVDATVENLDAVNDFIEELLSPLECLPKNRLQIDLAVEEIFVNIANYAYGDKQGKAVIRVSICQNPPIAEFVFMDEGMPYNPLAKEDPDINLSAEQRQIGGLGVFLVKKIADYVNYEHKDGKNVLTIQKKLT